MSKILIVEDDRMIAERVKNRMTSTAKIKLLIH